MSCITCKWYYLADCDKYENDPVNNECEKYKHLFYDELKEILKDDS